MDLLERANAESLETAGLKWLNEPPEWGFSEGELHIVPEPVSDFRSGE